VQATIDRVAEKRARVLHSIDRSRHFRETMLNLPLLHRKIVLYITLTSAYSAALQKYWLPDLEWQTASNWADGRAPQIDNRVIFSQQTRHAVGIAAADDLRLSGIDLPRQGSLVLPRNGKVQVRMIYEPNRRNHITEVNRARERT
jgi:hypothetical protein